MSHEPNFVRLAENGRISIPARFRKQLGLERGGIVVAHMENGELRLRSVREVIANLQDRVGKFLPKPDGSGVDWLLAQRRHEFAEEQTDIEGAPSDEHSGRERDHRPAGEGAGARDGR